MQDARPFTPPSPKTVKQIRQALASWYATHQRDLPWRRTRAPYPIWVSEVMLQQTRVQTVIPYFHRFLERLPALSDLAAADPQMVLKLWEGLGYYSRVRNLQKAARQVIHDHAGQVPDDWDRFRALPGVGDYIAAAVLSIAFDQPYAVVDGNVKRVTARLFRIEAPANHPSGHSAFRLAAGALLDPANARIHNQALMELGALVCRPKSPDCPICPVRRVCLAAAANQIAAYPRRIKRSPTPLVHLVTGIVSRNKRLLITRRKTDGLLGGLWEFPGDEAAGHLPLDAACIRAIKARTNLEVQAGAHLTTIRHAYTHFRIVLDVFECRYVAGRVRLDGPVAHRWVPLAKIRAYPLHKANLKIVSFLESMSV